MPCTRTTRCSAIARGAQRNALVSLVSWYKLAEEQQHKTQVLCSSTLPLSDCGPNNRVASSDIISISIPLSLSLFTGGCFCTPVLRNLQMASAARWRLEGKTALVTGGTKGLGFAIVQELAELGASVFTCCRNYGDLAAALDGWKAQGSHCL